MGEPIDLSTLNAARIGHDYFMKTRDGNYTVEDLNFINEYVTYLLNPNNQKLPKYKVGLMFVCINPHYWQFAMPVLEGVKNLFLPGHDTEIMLFSDIPEKGNEKELIDQCPPHAELSSVLATNPTAVSKEYVRSTIDAIRGIEGVTLFPVESVPWPYPTLMRYHMFLQQEEYLKKFDYLFYMDLDMRVVNIVGDEILGPDLTAAEHPMYSHRQSSWYPYEPNKDSQAFIKTPGRMVMVNGQPMFKPLYAAGGFQGGKTEAFIDAMKAMKKGTDIDLNKNYVARWNDESHWNRYLFDHPPSVVLSPSYIYPDSMIKEYYRPIWGCDYTPRIITLTKSFSLSKEGGAVAAKMMEDLKPLQ